MIDRAVLRDGQGVPYLAGSAIKGKLRHGLLRVLLADGQRPCQTGDGATWCENATPCPVCRLFGSPRREGALFFTDAYPAGDAGVLMRQLAGLPRQGFLPRDAMVRARTAIDRGLGTVRAGFLFSTEVLPGFLVFEGKMYGDIGTHLVELKQACRVVTSFGADRARGLGQCEITINEVQS